MKNHGPYDIISVGDVVIDAFIKLTQAEVQDSIDHKTKELCVTFGDKIPFESVEVIYAVGNSANAAVSASRLGLHAAFVSTVGADDNGEKCIESLEKDGVSTEYIKKSTEYPTNYHYVLWYASERTILVKHAPFPYSLPENMTPPKWIYLTSLGQNSIEYHKEIYEYLKNNPEVKLAFQPGTFQIKLGKEVLKDIYSETDFFCCNVEEAQRILNVDHRDVKTLMKSLAELGPKMVSVTDGFDGSYLFDGEKCWFIKVYPHTPFERTGAGDAFTSTFVSALALGKSPAEALLMAPINAMSVTQKVGAQKGLLTMEELQEYLEKAPDDYTVQEI
jgi:ribokinase